MGNAEKGKKQEGNDETVTKQAYPELFTGSGNEKCIGSTSERSLDNFQCHSELIYTFLSPLKPNKLRKDELS